MTNPLTVADLDAQPTPSGERRCSVGVDHKGEPIFEQFVRLTWVNEQLAAKDAELAAAQQEIGDKNELLNEATLSLAKLADQLKSERTLREQAERRLAAVVDAACDSSMSELLLHCGEMSRSEQKAVKAAIAYIGMKIETILRTDTKAALAATKEGGS